MSSNRLIYTRDFLVPLSDDDREMQDGWRCIPVPPTADDDWVIADNSKDYKTGWMLRCYLSDCEGMRAQ
jgi:hypothetical protein